jgi:hypothetical protein
VDDSGISGHRLIELSTEADRRVGRARPPSPLEFTLKAAAILVGYGMTYYVVERLVRLGFLALYGPGYNHIQVTNAAIIASALALIGIVYAGLKWEEREYWRRHNAEFSFLVSEEKRSNAKTAKSG